MGADLRGGERGNFLSSCRNCEFDRLGMGKFIFYNGQWQCRTFNFSYARNAEPWNTLGSYFDECNRRTDLESKHDWNGSES